MAGRLWLLTAAAWLAVGSQFDQTYIEQEVAIHKAVLDLAEKAHDQAKNQELKALIEQAKPVIEKHLKLAEEIQQKLGKPTAATANLNDSARRSALRVPVAPPS